ncbi:MAG: AraC family transcriptional regulator [Bacteroidaceae bacterium]|nr:AraC family transcriptional regulator [Bacteroidaceae bacterium]
MERKYHERLSQARIDRVCQILYGELFQQEAFLQQGLTARMVAERNGITLQDISAVCSEYFGDNFPMLLQRLRVKRVCRLLSSKEYERVSCENIGLRCGFSSRQSLHNAFRRQKGMTPEEYRKQNLNNNEKNSNTNDSGTVYG